MLLIEEQINKFKEAGIKYPFVNDNCIGCGACVAISPDVFTMNDEGKSEVLFLESYEDLGVDNSIMACPVESIKWVK